MTQVLRTLVSLVWACWFGGMVALLIFVIRLFRTSHEIGVTAAPVLFRTFSIYQFILGGVGIVLLLLLLAVERSRAVVAALMMMVISLLLAWPIRGWTIRIGELYAAGQSSSEEFKAIHRMSSATYSTSAIVLLIAGIALSVGARRSKQTSV